jgi:hypothetical protein
VFSYVLIYQPLEGMDWWLKEQTKGREVAHLRSALCLTGM